MTVEITTVADRPELVPRVARWLWEEWGRPEGRALEDVAAAVGERVARCGPEQCVVLLDGGVLAGTASLVHVDLDGHPELTPWLASVFVDQAFRGRGHGARLVRAIEGLAAAVVPTLWLHTATAPGLYARLGWVPAGHGIDHGVRVQIMRRDFGGASGERPPAAGGR